MPLVVSLFYDYIIMLHVKKRPDKMVLKEIVSFTSKGESHEGQEGKLNLQSQLQSFTI